MELLRGTAGKAGLVVVLLLVAVGFLVFRRERAPARRDEVHMVCVVTGKTFWVDRQPMALPLENPDTGEKTLLRCYEGEDGALYVDRSCRDLVKQLDEDKVNQYIDPRTLRVRSDP